MLFIAFSTHSFFHFQTSWMKFSLPRSWRLKPRSLISFFSTTTCVAMPAWSQPGFHSVVSPRILCLQTASRSLLKRAVSWGHGAVSESRCSYHLVRQSWMALVRAWPKCRDPVTLGGGMHIMKMPRGFFSLTLFLCRSREGQVTKGQGMNVSAVGREGLLTPYSGLKKPCRSHHVYHAASTYWGLYESGRELTTSESTKKRIIITKSTPHEI